MTEGGRCGLAVGAPGVVLALALAVLVGACTPREATATRSGSLIEIVYLDMTEEHAAADPAHGPPLEGALGEEGAGEALLGDAVASAVEAADEEDPLDAEPVAPQIGTGIFKGSHPIMRDLAVQLVERLRAEGIHVKLLMGYTPYVARKKTGPGGWASWHEFGLAFDLNLAKRKSLADAKKHFAQDERTWKRIGAIAEELGLVWGGGWRSTYDPFHFEWHPGHDSVINKDDLKSFLKLAGKKGRHYQKVWTLFDAADDKDAKKRRVGRTK
ncbi:MAG: M15 family metallopeptidase [Deltaproteobacteria bacterium]|nr:M15 family metallopeptidase [Deltaproteobacteria bacterium]